MNIYNVTGSAGNSYLLSDRGQALQNEENTVDQPFCNLIATTAEELMDWYQENVIKKLEPTLAETDPIEYHYRMFGGRGQRIYNWEGKLYTYEEYYPIMIREANKALAEAGAFDEDVR